MKTSLTIVISLLVSLMSTRAGLLDALGFGKKGTNDTAALPAGLTASLSQDQVAQGLKEALGKGVQQAVSQLGHDGGFLTNLAVKIPMPEKLRTAEKTLRVLKQDKLADEFVSTMNHAAEQAVPQAAYWAGVKQDHYPWIEVEVIPDAEAQSQALRKGGS